MSIYLEYLKRVIHVHVVFRIKHFVGRLRDILTLAERKVCRDIEFIFFKGSCVKRSVIAMLLTGWSD